MTIFQIECFLSVAEFLNFARAAEQMHVSQPAITRQIKSLEDELGTKLFIRNTRIVKLTESGQIFLADAHTMVSAAHRSVKRFAKKDAEKIIDFTIGCSNPLHMEQLIHTLHDLKKDYPTIHPNIRISAETHFSELLEQETLDIAIGFHTPTIPSSIHYKELKKTPFVCVMQKDMPLASLKTIHKEDLTSYSMILYTPGSAAPSVIDGQWKWTTDKKPSELYLCETTENILLLVHAGFGVALLPDFSIPKREDLVTLPLACKETISFGLYYKTVQQKPYLKRFIELLSHGVKKEE